MDFDLVMNLFWIWIWHGTIQPARNDFAQKLFSKQLATSYAHMEVKPYALLYLKPAILTICIRFELRKEYGQTRFGYKVFPGKMQEII